MGYSRFGGEEEDRDSRWSRTHCGCGIHPESPRDIMERQAAARRAEEDRKRYQEAIKSKPQPFVLKVGFEFRLWLDSAIVTNRAQGIRVKLRVKAEDVDLTGHGIAVRNYSDAYNEIEGGQKALSRALRDLTAGVSGPRLQRIERAVWAAWQAMAGVYLPLSPLDFTVRLKEGNVKVVPPVY